MSPEKYVTATSTIEVPVATVSDTMHAGLRQTFVTAETDEVTAELTSGAGLASPYLILTVERPGKPDIRETIDVRDFLPNWVDAAIARADASAEVPS